VNTTGWAGSREETSRSALGEADNPTSLGEPPARGGGHQGEANCRVQSATETVLLHFPPLTPRSNKGMGNALGRPTHIPEELMAKAERGGRSKARRSLANLNKVRTTLGELIAAAFDTVGNGVDVVQVLTSRELSRAAHARIVLQ